MEESKELVETIELLGRSSPCDALLSKGGMMLVDIESLESDDAGIEGGGGRPSASSHGSGCWTFGIDAVGIESHDPPLK